MSFSWQKESGGGMPGGGGDGGFGGGIGYGGDDGGGDGGDGGGRRPMHVRPGCSSSGAASLMEMSTVSRYPSACGPSSLTYTYHTSHTQ